MTVETTKKNYNKPVLYAIQNVVSLDAGGVATLAELPDEELLCLYRQCKAAEDQAVLQANPDVIKRHIGEEWLLVPTGTLAQHFNGMVSLTEVGDFIWDQLRQPMSLSDLLDAVRHEFDGNAETIDLETRIFVSNYARMGFLNEVK